MSVGNLIKLSGKLIYDPKRPGVKKTGNGKVLILQPYFDDIDLLYQWFIKRRFGLPLQRPVWKPHVTAVSIKEKPLEVHWKKYADEMVSFEYSPEVEQHWKFWVLPIKCDRLNEIRAELGLAPHNKFHMTIGRMF